MNKPKKELKVVVNNITERDKQVALMAERLMKKWTAKQEKQRIKNAKT